MLICVGTDAFDINPLINHLFHSAVYSLNPSIVFRPLDSLLEPPVIGAFSSSWASYDILLQ